MKIEFELTNQDLINFNLYHISHSDTIKSSMVKQRYIVPVIYCAIPFILIKVTIIPLWCWLPVFALAAVMWVIFFPRYYKWRIVKSITRMIDKGKNIGILGKRTIILTDAGILETGDSDEIKTNWNLIEHIGETEEYIYIYNSSVSAYIIPTRAFDSMAEKEEFVWNLRSAANFAHV